MNEREEFLRQFRSDFINMVDRLESMTESQVLNGILEVKAARRVWEREVAERISALVQAGPSARPRGTLPTQGTREEFAVLSSMQAVYNATNKLNELRMRAGAKVRPVGTLPFAALEDALHDRLASLRNGPSDDHS
jgi:hypothetical protein